MRRLFIILTSILVVAFVGSNVYAYKVATGNWTNPPPLGNGAFGTYNITVNAMGLSGDVLTSYHTWYVVNQDDEGEADVTIGFYNTLMDENQDVIVAELPGQYLMKPEGGDRGPLLAGQTNSGTRTVNMNLRTWHTIGGNPIPGGVYRQRAKTDFHVEIQPPSATDYDWWNNGATFTWVR